VAVETMVPAGGTQRHPSQVAVPWARGYRHRALLADAACALTGGTLALWIRFPGAGHALSPYVVLTIALPLLWVASVALAGGYDSRFTGSGSEEFRRVLNAGVYLTAGVAILSYAGKLDIARGYVLMALPCATATDLAARRSLRKGLHRLRGLGDCMQRVVAVGHASAVAALVTELRRESHHGLSVIAACLVDADAADEVEGIPVWGDLSCVTSAVRSAGAHAVAVLSCPEMDGARLRDLAWELEKTGTDLCVAPALMDVAGPRTTIRPVAGLPLLHVDHPELAGIKKVVKGVFDRAMAAAALVLLAPLMVGIALAIRRDDGGPALFRQTRIGKNGRPFTVLKFRTMVPDAEQRKTELVALNDADGVLFKIRNDPRITRTGSWLRRWSLDELPQLINVIIGDMSLVGPRPALPAETAMYASHARRRLVVKPGMTGLWQINGRSNLSWDEAVRLDLRYVENWSLALDLQILWKTRTAVMHNTGAY
jgi:exopolysaccharide biosynthesis polyprenyl glycosylphosphotransferase